VDRPLGGPLIEVAPQVTIPPLKITTGSLPPIALGEGWSAQLEASGGVAPYTWSLSDALPVGIDLDENAGRLAGTPTVAGDAAFTITVEDSRGVQATRRFELSVPKPRLPGDINRDGAVDCTDLNALRAQWNETGPDLEGDLNDDDTVDLTDMSILLSNWSGDENSSTC
jgi:hypothetical protein